MLRLVALLFAFTFSLSASTLVKGYKNQFFNLDVSQQQLCKFNSKFQREWCVDVQKDSLGMYVGFNQVIVYSKQVIQAVDIIRQQVKWSINMNNVFKIHINYPVVVIFSLDKTISGYDYFSGFQLWQKYSTGYTNMFESESNLWVLKGLSLDQMDVFSGDVIQSISLNKQPNKLMGDNLYFFYESDYDLYHFSLYLKKSMKVGSKYNLLDRSSDLVWLGNDEITELRTMSNRIVSEDIKEDLFVVHSPTNSRFAFTKSNQLYFITQKGIKGFEFTPTKNNDIIEYGYKLNDKVRVFYKNGQDLWILKPLKKNKSVPGT